eukprot:765775-Pleurochrysis_carterae.AAC.1
MRDGNDAWDAAGGDGSWEGKSFLSAVVAITIIHMWTFGVRAIVVAITANLRRPSERLLNLPSVVDGIGLAIGVLQATTCPVIRKSAICTKRRTQTRVYVFVFVWVEGG